ncbi:MAG: hypothetical protein ACLVJ6_16010 [Merdibacter sp.]
MKNCWRSSAKLQLEVGNILKELIAQADLLKTSVTVISDPQFSWEKIKKLEY